MSAIADRLNQVGKDLLEATNTAYAHAEVLERKWDAHTAEEARRNLCEMLKKLHTNPRFWSDLANPVARTLDPGIVDELMHMDLLSFEEAEIQTFRDGGLNPDLARLWAREASSLLFVVRLGFGGQLPEHLRPDIAKARASVKMAHQQLCVENPRLTDPGKRTGWNKFWGALNIVGGLGTSSLNGALLLAGPATGGLSAVFGGGTVLTGLWRVLDGARRLQEIKKGES